MIRMAVVGAGSIGMEHIRALEKAEGCCLCAVCDTDENRAAQAAKPYGVPWLTDYREIPGPRAGRRGDPEPAASSACRQHCIFS